MSQRNLPILPSCSPKPDAPNLEMKNQYLKHENSPALQTVKKESIKKPTPPKYQQTVEEYIQMRI